MESYIKNAKGNYKTPLVSIVIPCRSKKDIIYKYPKECELIIIVGDEPPGRLRDYGARLAKGKYLAFIDSDAYPRDDWYTKVSYYSVASKSFCGPGVLPPKSPFLEVITDLIYKCMPFAYRVSPKRARRVVEFPTFNLIIERDFFLTIGGFDTDMITGEDSILCKKINDFPFPRLFYFPDVVVFHRRRLFGKPYFRQISQYGRNRGHLIRLALLGWITTIGVYIYNFVRGFFRKKI